MTVYWTSAHRLQSSLNRRPIGVAISKNPGQSEGRNETPASKRPEFAERADQNAPSGPNCPNTLFRTSPNLVASKVGQIQCGIHPPPSQVITTFMGDMFTIPSHGRFVGEIPRNHHSLLTSRSVFGHVVADFSLIAHYEVCQCMAISRGKIRIHMDSPVHGCPFFLTCSCTKPIKLQNSDLLIIRFRKCSVISEALSVF